MLNDQQKDFLESLPEPEWTGQWLAEKLAAGEEKVLVKFEKDGRRGRLTLKGEDIEAAIRYVSPKLTDWLDSRHSLKR